MPKKGYKHTKIHEWHRFKSRVSWKRDKVAKENIAKGMRGHTVSDKTKVCIQKRNQLKIYQTAKLEEHLYQIHGRKLWMDRRKKFVKCDFCEWLVPLKVDMKEYKIFKLRRSQKLQTTPQFLVEMDEAIENAVKECS